MLVVDFSGLGSTSLAIPVLRALEAAHPAILYAYPDNALLADPEMRRASGLRGLLGLTPSRWRRFYPSDFADIATYVRKHGIDTVLNFRNPSLAVDTRYTDFQAWCIRHGLQLRWHDLYEVGDVTSMHVHERMQAVLSKAGFPVGPLRCEWLRGAYPHRSTRRTVGIFNCASTPVKRWPLDRWVALAKALADEDLTFLVLAGVSGDERDHSLALAEQLAGVVAPRKIAFASAEGVRDLAVLLSSLSVLVANDTGVGHLAAACGTPVVSLFSSTDPRVWRPRAADVFAVQSKVGARCPNQRPLQGNCTHHYGACDAPCQLDVSISLVADAVRHAVSANRAQEL